LLAIADNGSGFDPGAARDGGLGLVSMAERVRAIGGEFAILSDAREGTRLEVRVPVRERSTIGYLPSAIS
jgi:NarL family two-component system sensor histidine kinase LiaS